MFTQRSPLPHKPVKFIYSFLGQTRIFKWRNIVFLIKCDILSRIISVKIYFNHWIKMNSFLGMKMIRHHRKPIIASYFCKIKWKQTFYIVRCTLSVAIICSKIRYLAEMLLILVIHFRFWHTRSPYLSVTKYTPQTQK